jgi:hypothetical protein
VEVSKVGPPRGGNGFYPGSSPVHPTLRYPGRENRDLTDLHTSSELAVIVRPTPGEEEV